MMLVGPMKRKVILTAVISCLIPIIILGVVGFFVVRNYNEKIAKLTVEAEVQDRYVLKEDLPVNHVITSEDLTLVGVKGVSAPSDSYKKEDLKSLIGRRLKVNAKSKTIITESMFFEEDKEPTIDLRLQEFNMITLPSDLVENDYIDVRVRFPSGEDYSVLIGKKVEAYSEDTVFIKLTEEEILTVGSAIVESYILDGTKLYANKYIDPANQLFDYTEVDYVAKYNNVISELTELKKEEKLAELKTELLTTNPAATEEELTALEEQVDVKFADLSKEEIVAKMGLQEEQVDDIEKAIAENKADVLNLYRHMINVEEKQIAMTYPVKENVLKILKANPNILEEIKANYNPDTLLAQRLEMPTTEITEENIEKIKAALTKEIQTQKEERVAYLKELLNNEQEKASN